MANISGPQPDIRYCPACKENIRNVPREEMTSSGYERADGTVAQDTHTYECEVCLTKFEINQQQ